MGRIVAVLITDIVGSTQRWVRDEAAMSVDLAEHDRLVAAVARDHGGVLVKHLGDGGLLRFDDAADAIAAAVELQRCVANATWMGPTGLQLRAAIHTGSVEDRDGDVYGSAVNRAARLTALCPPGAILVSGATAAVVLGRDLHGIELTPLGATWLRGFDDAELVNAVVADGIANVDAPSISATGPRRAPVPAVDGRLIGRTAELALTTDALREAPVTTILGPGGIGKTRLAVEAVRHLDATSLTWCDLTTATAGDAVAPVVLAALGARHVPGRTALDSIVDALSITDSVLVLDNCEHVIDDVRRLVGAIRIACPNVRTLATSREAIGLPGEQLIPIGGLAIDDAVVLFVADARATRPELAVDQRGAADVARICERLDGIPLAIQLAASRCRSMAVAEIEERLGDRFRLLRGGRTAIERHRTLAAAISWSYELLDADERAVFEALATFADGTLLDGVVAVTGLDDFDALDVLDRLVARSMVVPVDTPLGTRYRELETLRQFAEDRLAERGELAALRMLHVTWAIGVAASMGSSGRTVAANDAFRRYLADLGNLRTAVSHALAADEVDDACGIVAALDQLAVDHPTIEMIEWLPPRVFGPPWSAARASAAGVVGRLRWINGDRGAVGEVVQAVPPEFATLQPVAVCAWLDHLWVRGDPDGADAAVARASATPDDHPQLRLLSQCPRLLAGIVAPEQTRRIHHDARVLVEAARATGDDRELANALMIEGLLFALGRRPLDALEPAAASAAIGERFGAWTLVDNGNGTLAWALGQAAADRSVNRIETLLRLRRFLQQMLEHRSVLLALSVLDPIALLMSEHDPERAYLLSRTYRSSWSTASLVPDSVFERLTDAERTSLDARAAAMSPDDGVAFGLEAIELLLADGRIHGGPAAPGGAL